MPEIILADHHEQVFSVWTERKQSNLKVAHVDFHCDMRGILIDRPAQNAFFTSKRETTFVDRGNFLGHAIMSGIVTDLKWIHAPMSGRAFDAGPVLSYESDIKAALYRLRHSLSGRSKVDVNYEECLLEDWSGLREGEQLDLDWDGLASVEFSKEKREALIENFLSRDLGATPDQSFLIYSPGYSDPDRNLYEDFAKELAKKFKAKITRLPEQELNTAGERFSSIRKLVKGAIPSPALRLKKRISLALRNFDAANDLDFFQKP